MDVHQASAYRALLRAQLGLITTEQAHGFGLDGAALRRRVLLPKPTWQRVLPRVYATFLHELTTEQKVRAAMLYAGEGAALTGSTAVRWLGIRYLPSEVKVLPVHILISSRRECSSKGFVVVHRTTLPPQVLHAAGLITAQPPRAVADCARQLTSYDTVLALVSAALNGGRTTIDELAQEYAQGPRRGSKLLRQTLLEASHGTRSVPEARLRRLLELAGMPLPLINEPILVNGEWLVPDLRWGWFIVEVDSKAHHLLEPGTWEKTVLRRAMLQAAGYTVLPVTPEMIMKTPELVVAAILAGYRESLVRAVTSA